jgi:phenylacetate-CoA ligase
MLKEIAQLRRLLHNKNLPPDALRSLQDSKLRRLVAHAWEHVPYYQSLFRSAGLSPGDIRTVEDLKLIPITTKGDIKKTGIEKAVAAGVSMEACHHVNTSGSTGIPFTVYLTPRDLCVRRMVEFRSLLSIGFRPRDRLSVLGPELPHALRLNQRLGFYWSENISALLPLEEQIQRLSNMRPTVFWAYPTALRALLHKVGDHLTRIIHPRILITSAEWFDDILRNRIHSIWRDIEIFIFYGAAELGRIALDCSNHQGLHVNADHVILEFPHDSPQVSPEKRGGVVVTALNAYGMPFIRYDLGDASKWIGQTCSCGSSFPLIDPVLGREDEMIQLPSGRQLSPFGLQYILRRVHAIEQFRFIQKDPGSMVVHLAVREDFKPECISGLQADCMRFFEEQVHLEVQIVPFIEVSGKFKTFTNLNKTI